MEAIRFRTEDGLSLEGEIHLPDGVPIASAVICHPHPQHGGSKDHPLLWAIRIELTRRGLAVLAFNYRGVMGSEGAYAGGVGEVEDAHAAIGRAVEEAGGSTFVCGWSFGANVALREAVGDDRVAALALLSIPLSDSSLDLPPLPDPDLLRTDNRPVFLLAGDQDAFCPVPELLTLAGRLPNATVEVINGADHFFSRREREAAGLVARFAEDQLS